MGVSPILLPWIDPLSVAATQHGKFALLYSSAKTIYSGRYSYLACDVTEVIESSDFSNFEKKLRADGSTFDNAWFGYLGYGLKNALEKLAPDDAGYIQLAKLHMLRPQHIYQFDHEQRTLTLWTKGEQAPTAPTHYTPMTLPAVKSLTSNMTRAQYISHAAQVIEAINRGDLYQANLTRKFMGEFEAAPDALALFARLCEVSPAPYSAFLQLGNTQIISSSPEMFLKLDASGHIRTRPIKGTAPRFSDAEKDTESRNGLGKSEKNRAENLMIVDLMRNDLSRSAALGSVAVESLFDVTTHATIHHMSSTITAQKADNRSALDIVRDCFPPGSMTGAPKIAAMELCSQLEKQERGVYSGAIGWFGGDGSCDLSVVIRTLVLQGSRFEFQVGGGIVADSTPEGELDETYQKARGILSCLGLPQDALADI
ncbi:MAG: aminodeoxychorismate synthase component I [Alphaproteobacteria bacterium]|nr:aminodeoxychorismate synthase component I [Alphaproteobacteria bacterium]